MAPVAAVAGPEFFGCSGTARPPEFRLVYLKYVPSLFLVEASSRLLTVRTNGSIHTVGKIVFCER